MLNVCDKFHENLISTFWEIIMSIEQTKICAIVNREVVRPIRLLGNQAMGAILV